MVVLMREADAFEQGIRPYASILGWGISSDGQGGITRPEVAGQRRALDRAWAKAGRAIGDVAFFEAHGTGTAVGDAVELNTLISARQASHTNTGPAWLGSIKANIGHTKAAAGVAGLIKATLALHHGVIPPMTGVRNPHELLERARDTLRLPCQSMKWPDARERLAGVSSFGFGGINVHLALRGAPGVVTDAGLPSDLEQDSEQDAELFLFALDLPFKRL